MSQWTYWTLPMPVIAKQGGSVPLETMLKQSFGGVPAEAEAFFAAYYGYADMAQRDFDFWDPNAAKVDKWLHDGFDIGAGFANQYGFWADAAATVSMEVGNTIGPVSYLAIPVAGEKSAWTAYIEYSVMTIDPDLMMKGAGKKAPKPSDIVNQAYRFADKYGTPINSNDCHYIAAAVAASAGATFTAGGNTQNVVDPGQNIEHGFWRIAYRGSDADPVENWQTLVKPGDIVRMGWNNGGFHTVTILDVSKDKKTITVYDNGNAGGTIGIHEVRYGEQTKPESITIYRLTTENLYLETGSDSGERMPGTVFNDSILGKGGSDTLYGAGGNDRLNGGAGGDGLIGGSGSDTASYAGAKKGVTADLANPKANTNDAKGDSYASIENLEGSGKSDKLGGDAKKNVLDGGAGADRLTGARGADKLYAGLDKATDTFVFAQGDSGKTAKSWDQIFEFRPDTDNRKGHHMAGADLIDLSAIDGDTAEGDQALRFVSKFGAPKNGGLPDGQVRVKDAGAHLNVEIDWTGDNRADMVIQVMNVAKLTADDFIL